MSNQISIAIVDNSLYLSIPINTNYLSIPITNVPTTSTTPTTTISTIPTVPTRPAIPTTPAVPNINLIQFQQQSNDNSIPNQLNQIYNGYRTSNRIQPQKPIRSTSPTDGRFTGDAINRTISAETNGMINGPINEANNESNNFNIIGTNCETTKVPQFIQTCTRPRYNTSSHASSNTLVPPITKEMIITKIHRKHKTTINAVLVIRNSNIE